MQRTWDSQRHLRVIISLLVIQVSIFLMMHSRTAQLGGLV